ncbi:MULTISPECIES: molybdenum cofactor cytidylyltransferase [Clostridioides]|uniref:molybdenum cofactor cytidylyltransferase n=1 Tax=Clostridioides sp. ZZV14-6387 TaxID=2811497 RepID=UPI0007BAE483|nr:molybdenum cofactor cytidylyltransferase [Clostridioides sp. ZZV14-6387]CZR97441.1 molybdopterin-guanine dinucleotide biosynthesis protein MobA [Clostridioides difficile]CZS00917.1 molybdopterin-guanine dinucleotide biosynthesis protein MobA [Clostridioides difficile]
MINAVIMASGFARRMGTNKLLLDYKGCSIIEHVLKAVSKINFHQVVVVSQYKEVSLLCNKYGFKYVDNKNANIGQSESIKLGILNSSKCDGYMFFVGDQPFIDSLYIDKIINTFKLDRDFVVIPRCKDVCGNPVIFPYSKKEELLALKEDEKGKTVLKNASKIKYVEVPREILLDIDTKTDYERIGGKL